MGEWGPVFLLLLKLPGSVGRAFAAAGWQDRVVRNEPLVSGYLLKLKTYWWQKKIGWITYFFQLNKYQVITGNHNEK